MTAALDVAKHLDRFLQTDTTPDYPGAVNGLQIDCLAPVRKVAAAVDFSSRAIDAAIAADANLLLVHHGMFWSGAQPMTGASYRRLRKLVDNDIAVYSSHLPLDRHPEVGNNVLLARELELTPTGEFASHRGVAIGVSGETSMKTDILAERVSRFSQRHGGNVTVAGKLTDRTTMRWAICTGAGASAETLAEAAAKNIDTLIVGEGPHWTGIAAEEEGLVIIYAGHYATETLGVQALAAHLERELGLPWTFIAAPTGL